MDRNRSQMAAQTLRETCFKVCHGDMLVVALLAQLCAKCLEMLAQNYLHDGVCIVGLVERVSVSKKLNVSGAFLICTQGPRQPHVQ